MLCRLVQFALLLTMPASVSAQDLLSIAGKVVDARNAPIPGATVKLHSGEPGPPVEALTELDGAFDFPNLPSGSYKLVVEMTGFQNVTLEPLDPASDSSRSLVVTLRRPDAPERDRPDAPAGRTARTVANPGQRPANGRGFQEVAVDGVSAGEESSPASSETGANGPGMVTPEEASDVLVISGNTTASFGAGDFNDPQFRERMMEMAGRMGFGAGEGRGFEGRDGGFGFGGRFGGGGDGPGGGRFGGGGDGPGFGGFGGRGAGRGQARVNGSVFSSYRNSSLNARPYSITGAEVDKPLQIQNNFGLSLGGPLPWGVKGPGNRPMQQPGMWFFTYEGSRNRNPFDILTTVPTALEREGDLSQTSLRAGPLAGRPVQLRDPSTSALFTGSRIPLSRMNSAAVALLKYIPLPNLPGSVQNFTMQRGLIGTSDSFSGRLTSRVTAKDNLFVSYSTRSGDSVTSQIFPGLDTDRTNRAHNILAGGVHRFRPRFILNYRFTVNRVRTESTNPFASVNDIAGQLGIEGTSRDPVNYGIPTINFTNYGDLRLGNPSLTHSRTFTAGAGLNRIGNRHTISMGGDISWNRRDNRVDTNARGTFEFTGFATSAFDAQGRPVAGTGHDLADFLLGLPYSTSRRFGNSETSLRNRSLNLFVQDNWRVRANLTVNFGLRYEYNPPFHEEQDRIVGLDVARGFVAAAQVFPNGTGPYTGEFPRSLLFPDRNNFGPRIGIALKPSAASKWVLRAGYGLFYNPSVYPYVYSQLVGQPPFAVGQDILTTLASPLTLQNGFPFDPNVSILNTYAIDPHYRIGYVQQWNLNVQTQVARLYTVEVGYNASKGTRLDILRAPNRAPSGVSPGSTEDNRVIANAGNFVYQSSGANSVLHSLRLRVNRRFSRGIRMENSYTFGKSIDNASGIGGGNLLVVQDEGNIRGERARSSFDQRHRFESEFNIELPFGDRRKFFPGVGGIANQVISGWNLNGSYNFNSGTPLTARVLGNLSNNSGTGSNSSERPDSTGIPASLPGSERSTSRYFDTLAFALPAPGRFGNAGRNTIPGPGSNLLNLSLRKNFRLDDSNRRLEFRWQVTNVLNHPNFAGVGTVINALNFGRVTGARSMRQMQFNLRLNF